MIAGPTAIAHRKPWHGSVIDAAPSLCGRHVIGISRWLKHMWSAIHSVWQIDLVLAGSI
ncbi:uncharacterized protein EI97DRAFT_429522 [Westerdykella ornata]|uniref:Uncharacterized protein n=1 Tax=Westerdykella ornata TaxID=318751 RepID=A0A6A6JZJ2_WESOR|nr:uncharacterized protein EI97DRAFT_429522 [Westerdykella ornata]KAF2281503.1 hypothetical protein EI97DRAFT_429522 [Westerdykella ornata]